MRKNQPVDHRINGQTEGNGQNQIQRGMLLDKHGGDGHKGRCDPDTRLDQGLRKRRQFQAAKQTAMEPTT